MKLSAALVSQLSGQPLGEVTRLDASGKCITQVGMRVHARIAKPGNARAAKCMACSRNSLPPGAVCMHQTLLGSYS